MNGDVFGGIAALGDPLRARVILALERQELMVAELCAVFQVPQSTMSRYLKVLADQRWITARAEGPSRRYRLNPELAPVLMAIWGAVRDEVAGTSEAKRDAERLREVLAARVAGRRRFFSDRAGDWERLRVDLVGRRLDAVALLAMIDDTWNVGDLGCGTGSISKLLAPFVRQVVAVDESPEMLELARANLEGQGNIELRGGSLEQLPVTDGELDAAVIFLALQYSPDPEAVVREGFRSLRAGGKLIIVDLVEHNRLEYVERFGHQSLGFDRGQIEKWMRPGGTAVRWLVLPEDPETRGPRLFVASAKAVA